MTDLSFIHLRLHSEYSLLEGAVRLKSIPELCRSFGMPAVALTDTNNMFAALEFSVLLSGAGIQPILGCQIDLSFHCGDTVSQGSPMPAPIVLLVQSEIGYKNLMKLNSCLYLTKDGQPPHINLSELETNCEGLICLTGGPNGVIGQRLQMSQLNAAEQLTEKLSKIFPDRLYVELQRHDDFDETVTLGEQQIEDGHLELAYAKDLPLVATNDVYFEKAEMYESHDALICIAEGAYVDQQEPRRQLTQEHYFKTSDEMSILFSDLPEALENTVEIARRCSFMASACAPILPKFADNEIEELTQQSRQGLQARLDVIPHAAPVAEYEERLQFELEVIEEMGFPGYFLIVADFIKWAKRNDIPVGPGRGSGAGSLVAFALTITDLDPLRYSLIFERFLNPERKSMPDFDIDFCMDRREEVISYVQQKHGKSKVGQIITFGALLSKAVVRDVGRVLQMPYAQVDRISKLIPVDGVKPVSIDRALEESSKLKEMATSEDVVHRLLTYGRQLEGLLRNASTHAAGIVIGDRPLDELVPLYQDPRSEMPATQFNMKWVEQAGLVKFDFLGLKTLTVIKNAVDLILQSGRDLHVKASGVELYEPATGMRNEINGIPLNDIATFELYSSAKTIAVFQVESSGMMDALTRMKPDCIEDIIALVALYRPGPMENIPKFCEVKNGISGRETLHPLIDHILDETQGIIVYQEQVMQIAREMAGYSLGEADLLRRAMGKKIQSAMDAERPRFLAGAARNNVASNTAEEIWVLLDKFANYGFNKSHAAAYAVVSYQTAWLKANHPVEFMAAVMNCDIGQADKMAMYFEEIKKNLDLRWIPPCVNRSNALFSVLNDHLVYGLGALKGVGIEAMRMLVIARDSRPFVNLFDFARRVDLKRLGKRSLEMLARGGAFDQLDSNRLRVFNSIESLISYSMAVFDARKSNQGSLFGQLNDILPEPRISGDQDWLPAERLAEEAVAVGFYLSGHPLDEYLTPLRHATNASAHAPFMTLDDINKLENDIPLNIRMAGIVVNLQERKSARGNQYAFCQLSDPTGAYEVTIFSDTLDASREFLDVGSKVILTVEATKEADQLKLLTRSMTPIDSGIVNHVTSGLRVCLEKEETVHQIANILGDACNVKFQVARGFLSLCLIAPDLPGEVEVDLGADFPVNPEIKGALKSLPGVVSVEDI
ncbi:MAG: DNA polymerase III subunit alpha [Aestuariivita sp.]|nr:DNA polymerase III subunit alpha [Aestuariivita sp.]